MSTWSSQSRNNAALIFMSETAIREASPQCHPKEEEVREVNMSPEHSTQESMEELEAFADDLPVGA
jgi:hypothetical protein